MNPVRNCGYAGIAFVAMGGLTKISRIGLGHFNLSASYF